MEKMSMSSRDTKLKKMTTRKKNDELGKLSPTFSETEERVVQKVIDGEDIQNLAIKESDLKKLIKVPKPIGKGHQSQPQDDKLETILVKKKNPHAYPTIEVKVAKLVPDKPIKPIDTSDSLGIRFDKYGNCIPHSILGNVEDFLKESIAHGKSIQLPYDTTENDRPQANVYLKDETASSRGRRIKAHLDRNVSGDFGMNALQNWEAKMNERESIQKRIASKIDRPINSLVENQSDNYLHYMETKRLIDRTLPLVEDGKGYRLGSEFWHQPLLIGPEENGIHMTLTKSQRGQLPITEFISKTSTTLKETTFNEHQPCLTSYPWDQSKYLNQRLGKLQPLIEELTPYRPDFQHLEVVGEAVNGKRNVLVKSSNDSKTWVNPQLFVSQPSQQQLGDAAAAAVADPYFVSIDTGEMDVNNVDPDMVVVDDRDPLSAFPDVVQPPIFGPCLVFGGQEARWSGDRNENSGMIALESRLNFETKAGKRVLTTFEIINMGTTVIHYDWRKVSETNPFQRTTSNVQRFYFDTRSNIIMPGDLLKLHIVFKSTTGGIYTEKWQFVTHPTMLSGAMLLLTLRGVAIQEDKYQKRRISIERNLVEKEAQLIAQAMVDLILSGVRTPERPSSPVDAFMSEEERFARLNPNLNYDHASVNEMKAIYADMMGAEDAGPLVGEWDLSIDRLKFSLLEMDEQETKKQMLLTQLNALVDNMSFAQRSPNHSRTYNTCYNLICSTMDEISSDLTALRISFYTANNDMISIYPTEVDEFNRLYEDWRREFEIFKQIENERKNRAEKDKNKEKSAKKGAGGGGGGGGNAAAAAAAAAEKKEKDDKKKAAAEVEKKKTTPVLSAKHRVSRDALSSASGSRTDKDRALTDEQQMLLRSRTPASLSDHQVAHRRAYTDKMYLNVYQLLVKMVDNMETLCSEMASEVEPSQVLSEYIKQNMEQKTHLVTHNDYID